MAFKRGTERPLTTSAGVLITDLVSGAQTTTDLREAASTTKKSSARRRRSAR